MPAVRYFRYGRNNVRVSGRWLVVLRAADRAGVKFTVNSGHRTMAEQRRLRQAYERYLAGGPWAPLAAKPTPWAPHIRVGRSNHALDINTLDGGERRLEAWLDRPGINAENTVAGEAWHLELSSWELWKLWRRYRKRGR